MRWLIRQLSTRRAYQSMLATSEAQPRASRRYVISVLQTCLGLTTAPPTQPVGRDLVLRVRPARGGPRRHAGQPQLPHQAWDPLAIDAAARRAEGKTPRAAAVERVSCVRLVEQATAPQLGCIDRPGLWLRRDRGAGDPGPRALPDHGYRIPMVDPRVPRHDRLIPDFLLSQSNATFSVPISRERSSGSRCAARGAGPRVPSHSVLACS